MAGYDLSFETKVKLRPKVQEFLKCLQLFYGEYDLEFRFKTTVKNKRSLYVYVTVDGALPTIQYVSRILPRVLDAYLIFNSYKKDIVNNIVIPFFEANQEGVYKITEDIFELTKKLNAHNISATPNNFAISNYLLKIVNRTRNTNRMNKVIRGIIFTIYDWFSGYLDKNRVIVLLDKYMEDWLKIRLSLPKNSRKGFQDALNEAYDKGLITKMEKYRLKRFHDARNRVYHRGGTVKNKTVYSMVSYYIRIIDKYSGSGIHKTDLVKKYSVEK